MKQAVDVPFRKWIRPRQPQKRREALALVWAEDGGRVQAALEHLRADGRPSRRLLEVAGIRRLPDGEPCPLRPQDPALLAYQVREGWMWALVSYDTQTWTM